MKATSDLNTELESSLTLGKVSRKTILVKKVTINNVQPKPLKIQLPKSILMKTQESPVVKKIRPLTPELNLRQCLDCDKMKDFIQGLQGEIKRLQVRWLIKTFRIFQMT
jgi:hypothetical protein